MDYIILNSQGLRIGMASADNPQAAVRAWNLANTASREVGVEADAVVRGKDGTTWTAEEILRQEG